MKIIKTEIQDTRLQNKIRKVTSRNHQETRKTSRNHQEN